MHYVQHLTLINTISITLAPIEYKSSQYHETFCVDTLSIKRDLHVELIRIYYKMFHMKIVCEH